MKSSEFNLFLKSIHELESKVSKLTHDLFKQEQGLKNQLNFTKIQIKRMHQGFLTPQIDNNSLLYAEMKPSEALKTFQTQKQNYFLLDVSHISYKSSLLLDEVIKVPLEKLSSLADKLLVHDIDIYVLSEDGVRSIYACNELKKLGFMNCINISGGYEALEKTIIKDNGKNFSNLQQRLLRKAS